MPPVLVWLPVLGRTMQPLLPLVPVTPAAFTVPLYAGVVMLVGTAWLDVSQDGLPLSVN